MESIDELRNVEPGEYKLILKDGTVLKAELTKEDFGVITLPDGDYKFLLQLHGDTALVITGTVIEGKRVPGFDLFKLLPTALEYFKSQKRPVNSIRVSWISPSGTFARFIKKYEELYGEEFNRNANRRRITEAVEKTPMAYYLGKLGFVKTTAYRYDETSVVCTFMRDGKQGLKQSLFRLLRLVIS